MAEMARRWGLETEVATFEDWEPGERRFDAVVCAQAWHWIDPDAGAAKAARALRPGGVLAIFWNAGLPPASLTAAFAEIYGRFARTRSSRAAGRVPPRRASRRCAGVPPPPSTRPAASPSWMNAAWRGSGATPATSGSTRCR